ncbi:hypothetical protein CIW61_09925 [Enterobacter cloacae]|nr:hypothetical protein CIW61_09925 [Enterobacter cloacae]
MTAKTNPGESRTEIMNRTLMLVKEDLVGEYILMMMGFIIFYHDFRRPKIGSFIKLMLIFFHRSHMGITKEEINQSLMHTSVGFTKIQLRLTV